MLKAGLLHYARLLRRCRLRCVVHVGLCLQPAHNIPSQLDMLGLQPMLGCERANTCEGASKKTGILFNKGGRAQKTHWLVSSWWPFCWKAVQACSRTPASCTRSPAVNASGLICDAQHTPKQSAELFNQTLCRAPPPHMQTACGQCICIQTIQCRNRGARSAGG